MDRAALRAVHAAYRDRGAHRSRSEIAYQVYVVLLLAVVLVPVGYGVIDSTRVSATILSRTNPRVVEVVAGVIVGAAVIAGRVRGPVHLSPFFAAVVGGGPLPRRVSMRRPYLCAALVMTGLGALAGAVSTMIVINAGVASVHPVYVSVGAGLFGLLVSVCWLAGQSAPWWVLVAFAMVGGLLSLGSLALPEVGLLTPWGMLAGLRPTGPEHESVALIALFVTTVAALAFVPRLLDGLRGPALIEQAQRWQSMSTTAEVGDLSGALGHFRAKPRVGHRWPAVGQGRSLSLLLWRRDLVGAARTPVRMAVGSAAIVVSGGVAALAVLVPHGWHGVPLAVSAGVAYLGLGVFSDGFRHAVEAAAAPALYGINSDRLLSLHALMPVSLVIIFVLIGAGAAVPFGGASAGAVAGVGGALFAVMVRAYDAAKGPLPPALLTPAPTPMGDASGVVIALWQLDAMLIAVAVATMTGGAALTYGSVALAAYVPTAAVLWMRLRRRMATT